MTTAVQPLDESDLVHLEQRVNDRFGTDPAPALAADMLPENGRWYPMAWAEFPAADLTILCDDPRELSQWRRIFEGAPGTLRFPIHPLVKPHYRDQRIVRSGRFAVSASYRTVFFEPEAGSALFRAIPDHHVMMIKLHLDEPLPGIKGDRRLTPNKVAKCIQLSAKLPTLLSESRYEHRLTVLRERAGIIHAGRGAIVRFVPRRQGFPFFSLYSRDTSSASEAPLLIRELESRGLGAQQVAIGFGEMMAEPLLRAVFAGFDLGFSLELHAQNTLGVSSPQRLIDSVLFRDLESVQYFPQLRDARAHAQLLLESNNPEFIPNPAAPRRWFNRNVDHDVGRILLGALTMLRRQRFLSDRQCAAAVRSCRRTYRLLVEEFCLQQLDRWSQWLPLSRAPYGKSWNRGGYFRTRFR